MTASVRVLPVRRFRLGAEELIEMGRTESRPRPDRRPFLGGRARRASMGAEELIEMGQPSGKDMLDSLASAGYHLAMELEMALDVLQDLTSTDLSDLTAGADDSAEAFTNLVSRAPAAADLLAMVLVAGAPFVKYGLSVPGIGTRGLGNVMAGAAKALSSRSEADNQASMDFAKKKIASDAKGELRQDILAVLDDSGVSGGDLAPRVDLNTGKTTPEIAPEGASA